MKNILSIAILSCAVMFTPACKKDKCSAGTGGDLTIVAYPQHHSKPILNHTNYRDTVYVKFNAKELPGISPSNYDAVFIGEDGEDHVHLEGLKCGDYFLYAVGLDTTIGQRVTGGIPYSTSQKDGEVVVNIPVTE